MKKFLLFLLFLISINSYSQENKLNSFESYHLDNGIKVILLPFTDTPKIGIYSIILSGSKHEGYGEKGQSHLLEHMLFKSSKKFSSIKNELLNISTEWNGLTSKDNTIYFEIVNEQKNLEKALEIEAQRLFNSTFTENDLKTEMAVVRNELEIDESSIKNLLFNSTVSNIFETHGYSHPTIGYKSDVESIKFTELQNYYKKIYQPKNLTILIYGNINKEKTKHIVHEYFSNYKNNHQFIKNYTTEEHIPKESEKNIFVDEKTYVTNISWNAPSFLYDEDIVSARIAWFASIKKPYGNLYKKYILNDQKLNIEGIINISPNILYFNDYNPFYINLLQKPGRTNRENIDAIIEDIEFGDAFSEESFEKTKLSMENDWKNIESNPESFVENLIYFERLGDWKLYFDYKKEMKNSSYEKAIRFFNNYIIQSNRSITTIKQKPEMLKSIKKDPLYYKKIKSNIIKKTNSEIDFKYTPIKQIEPNLISYRNATKTEKISNLNNNITLNLIETKTKGDYVYVSSNTQSDNIELDAQYHKVCYFMPNFLKFGNNKYTEEEINDTLTKLDIKMNSNFFDFYIKTPRENFSESLTFVLDLLENPKFDETKFKQQKESLLQSLILNQNAPKSLSFYTLQKEFNAYPIGHQYYPLSPKETYDMVKNITLEDTKKCYDLYKGYPKTQVSILGDITLLDAKKSLERMLNYNTNYKYSTQLKNKINTLNYVIEKNKGNSLKIGPTNKTNSYFSGLSIINIDNSSEDYYAMVIASHILGENANSRLFKNIRENSGLSYNISSNLSTNKKSDFSILYLHGNSAIKNSELFLNKLNSSWIEFSKNGITEEELLEAKKYIKKELKADLSNETQILNVYSSLFEKDKDINWLMSLYEKIDNAKLEEVNNIIKKRLSNNKIFTVYTY